MFTFKDMLEEDDAWLGLGEGFRYRDHSIISALK